MTYDVVYANHPSDVCEHSVYQTPADRVKGSVIRVITERLGSAEIVSLASDPGDVGIPAMETMNGWWQVSIANGLSTRNENAIDKGTTE